MTRGAPNDCEPGGSSRRPPHRPAPASSDAKVSAIVVSFDTATQELGPLLEAAYCLMSQAYCHINSRPERYVCWLVPKTGDPTGDVLRARFLDLVTDANLRARATSTSAPLP
jgi:hypothetical protein